MEARLTELTHTIQLRTTWDCPIGDNDRTERLPATDNCLNIVTKQYTCVLRLKTVATQQLWVVCTVYTELQKLKFCNLAQLNFDLIRIISEKYSLMT